VVCAGRASSRWGEWEGLERGGGDEAGGEETMQEGRRRSRRGGDAAGGVTKWERDCGAE